MYNSLIVSTVLCFAVIVTATTSSQQQQQQYGKESGTERWIVWEEIQEETSLLPTGQDKNAQAKVPRRENFFSWKRKSIKKLLNNKAEEEEEEILEPHPLRTNVWELQMHWRQLARGERIERRRLLVEFSSNGYVRILSKPPAEVDDNSNTKKNSSDSNTMIAIGSWKLTPTTLRWSIPKTAVLCDDDDDDHQITNNMHKDDTHDEQEEFIFGGDFHLNPFGSFPKLTRGVVLSSQSHLSSRHVNNKKKNNKKKKKNKKKWFRPVVATFTARGIGQDTADWSYQHRKR